VLGEEEPTELTNSNGRESEELGSLGVTAAALAIWLLPLCIAFSIWTVSSGWAFARFLCAVVFLAYVPGRFLLEKARLEIQGLDNALLSLIVGMIACVLVYWTCARFGLGSVWLVWPLATLGFMVRRGWKTHPPLGEGCGEGRPIHLGLAGVFLVVAAPFAITQVHYRNLVKLSSGGLNDFAFDDAIFHISIANELGHSVPPQIPFLPGFPLNYHYGPDLLVRMFADAANLSTIDLTLRFMPTLYMALTVIAIFCFARIWLRMEWAALLVVVLVILGDDFSFLPGMLSNSSNAWAAYLLRVPTTASLYTINPMLPGLAILFASFLCLIRLVRGDGLMWGVLSSLLLVVLVWVKVFTGAHVLGCLAFSALLYAWLRRDFDLLGVLLLTMLLAVPSFWEMLTGGGAHFTIQMGSSGYVSSALIRSGLAASTLGRHAISFESDPGTMIGAAWFLLLALPGFLLASFGARSFGLVLLLKKFRVHDSIGPLRILLAVFVLSGPLATLFLTIRPAEFPHAYDNAVWFFVQSKYVAWLFAVEALLVLIQNHRRLWRVSGAVLMLALSLPSGLQYVQKTWAENGLGPARVLDAAHLETLAYLNERVEPGAVVLAPLGLAPTVLTLTHCRSPALHLYTDSFISRDELIGWKRDLRAFWEHWTRGEVRSDVIARVGASYVLVRSSSAHPDLTPIFANEGFLIYDVAGD
jgi:hypothetical protein